MAKDAPVQLAVTNATSTDPVSGKEKKKGVGGRRKEKNDLLYPLL